LSARFTLENGHCAVIQSLSFSRKFPSQLRITWWEMAAQA
jgi:hypothetical protein